LIWFLGGEPLLNPEISAFIETSKEIDFAKVQAISTNGVLIPKMEERFFKAVDYIFVALYPALSKIRPRIKAHLAAQSRKNGISYTIAERSYFYDIETAERLSDDIAQASYRNCHRAKRGPFVENGYFYKCMRPVSTGEYLENRGYAGAIPDFRTVDGVHIHSPLLRERIGIYMSSEKCLESCYFCKMGLKDESCATLWRKIKSYFEDIEFLRNIIFRSSGILAACHAIQGIFERSFVKRAEARTVDIGVPLVRHRMLSREECRGKNTSIT
jgi:MoaA/NifB/PqqE/SkfB family radical SAM enzyme